MVTISDFMELFDGGVSRVAHDRLPKGVEALRGDRTPHSRPAPGCVTFPAVNAAFQPAAWRFATPTSLYGHIMFRRLSVLVLAAALAGGSLTAAAQRLFADFSGAWDVVVQGPQGPMASTLNLSQKGDSVSGRFESEVGSAKVAGGVRGDSLEILFSIDAGGQMLNLQGLGAMKEKDKIEGKIVAEGMGEFPFTATRQGK